MNYFNFNLSGFSLLTTLVSLMLGSLLLLFIFQFYVAQQLTHQSLFLQLDLQQELHKTLQLMTKDIQRIGLQAPNPRLGQSNFHLFQHQNEFFHIHQSPGESNNSCLLFIYDLSLDGCVGQPKKNQCVQEGKNVANHIQTELFGYTVKNSILKTRTLYHSSVKSDCDDVTCPTYLKPESCNTEIGWADLLNENYLISQLKFQETASHQAIEVTLTGYLAQHPQIHYTVSAFVPLLNKIGEENEPHH